MAFDKEALKVDLQAAADKFQVHLVGTVTPVSPEDDTFDIAAAAAPIVS